LFEVYAETSGRPFGDGIGVLRDLVIAPTDEQAYLLWRSSGAFCGAAWFEPFGFARGLLDPETGEQADLFRDGLALVGSPTTVSRQLAELRERLPVRWIFCWMYNGLVPHRVLLDTIERFWVEVLPSAA
jgi:alkanesulfonate monooxygenase SsuD/methylene tetrahydromethanopterin reductase-like flavin-dependent oxidoreductase (luciferase family)